MTGSNLTPLNDDDIEGVFFDVIGNLSTEDHPVGGWHVNARTAFPIPESLIPFCIERPKEPKRVWA